MWMVEEGIQQQLEIVAITTYATGEVTQVYPFSEEEYRKGIATFNNLCPNLHNWLLDMLNKCFTENMVPGLWCGDSQ